MYTEIISGMRGSVPSVSGSYVRYEVDRRSHKVYVDVRSQATVRDVTAEPF